jgi:aldehyde dehydrogenase (NAD+)
MLQQVAFPGEISRLDTVLSAQREWRLKEPGAFDISARRARLKRLLGAVQANRDPICAAVKADLGRAEAETQLCEIFAVATEIRHALRHLRSWTRSRWVAPTLAMMFTRAATRFEPKGVILIISPWNFPVSLAIGPLVSAVAAGNSVVLKPSEQAPATAALLARILRMTFLPEEVTCVTGDETVSRDLASLPFDHIFFTGSTEAGRSVLRASAETMATVTLELGGKSPAILLEDADLDQAAEKIAWGRFLNAGQTCLAPDYVLVPQIRYDAFAAALSRAIERLYGSALDGAKVDLARIVNDRHFMRLSRLLAESAAHGDNVIRQGEIDAETRLIGPTVILVRSPCSPLLAGEIFGPVLALVAYERVEDAITEVNRHPGPLCAYAFARRPRRALALLSQIRAGASVVNETVVHYVHSGLPFGGFGPSGMGRSHGRYGFEAFSSARAILVGRRHNPVRLLYPPYTGFTRFLIRATASWL